MAHKYIHKLIVAVLFCLLFAGCETKTVKTFDLTIITIDKLGNNKNDKFPEIFMQFCKPIDAICDTKHDYAFSTVIIKRLGLTEKDFQVKIIPDGDQSNREMSQWWNTHVEDAFKNVRIGSLFTEPNDVSIDFNKKLSDYFLHKTRNIVKYYYASAPETDSIAGAKLYNNTDSLKLAISKYLCEFPETSHIYIVYEPRLGKTDNDGDKLNKIVAKADSLLEKNQCKLAIQKYNEALTLDPKNDYVKKQLSKVDKICLPPPGRSSGLYGTFIFPYGKYQGGVKNKLMDGTGIMTFTERHIISIRDSQKRYAEAGDKLHGIWDEGYFVNGKLFDKNGEQKETLFIGN